MMSCKHCIDHTSIPYTIWDVNHSPLYAIDKFTPVFEILYRGIPPLHQSHVDEIINIRNSNPNMGYYHTFIESPLFLNNCSLYKEAADMFIGNYSEIKIHVSLESSEEKLLEKPIMENFDIRSSFDEVTVKIYAEKKTHEQMFLIMKNKIFT